jgi:hypothetical protein
MTSLLETHTNALPLSVSNVEFDTGAGGANSNGSRGQDASPA